MKNSPPLWNGARRSEAVEQNINELLHLGFYCCGRQPNRGEVVEFFEFMIKFWPESYDD